MNEAYKLSIIQIVKILFNQQLKFWFLRWIIS